LFYCLKIAAGYKPNLLERKAVVFALNHTQKNPSQDGRTFQYITCKMMPKNADSELSSARWSYVKNYEYVKPGGLGEDLSNYYNLGTEEHPNAKYLRGEHGN